MSNEQRAVALIFEKLSAEGLEWYKKSGEPGVALYTSKLRQHYSLAESGDVQKIRWTTRSQFQDRHIAILCPPDRDPEPLLAVWCRWDFTDEPGECHFYMGLWTKTGTDHTFVGFRFESPHEGDQHDFYHCQPCRNLGNRSQPDSTAVPMSEYVPTLALQADNSAELALNIVLAMRGKVGLQAFKRALFKASAEAAKNPVLTAGFARLLAL